MRFDSLWLFLSVTIIDGDLLHFITLQYKISDSYWLQWSNFAAKKRWKTVNECSQRKETGCINCHCMMSRCMITDQQYHDMQFDATWKYIFRWSTCLMLFNLACSWYCQLICIASDITVSMRCLKPWWRATCSLRSQYQNVTFHGCYCDILRSINCLPYPIMNNMFFSSYDFFSCFLLGCCESSEDEIFCVDDVDLKCIQK